MNKITLFLALFTLFGFAEFTSVSAEESRTVGMHNDSNTESRSGGWSLFGKKTKHHEPYRPYLESTKELQIPQWEDENWYVEDWTSQEGGANLIQGFYDADILRDQEVGKNDLPVMVVGPNFYRLSGLDKRRVIQTVDTIYGFTESKDNASLFLKDWHTEKYIGVFDKNGLRLN